MRTDRFFVTEQIGDKTQIKIVDKNLVEQWRRVLRMAPGVEMILCDNSGLEFKGRLMEYESDGAVVSILGSKEGENKVEKEVILACSVLKKDNFEWVAQKATELGVSKIVPVLADNSVKQNLRMDRLEKIVREASEQSERVVLPEVCDVQSLEDALSMMPQKTFVLETHLKSPVLYFRSITQGEGGSLDSLGFLVGPEGGWSEEEIAFFKERGVEMVTLGPQILRAETAAISVCALALLK